MAKVVGVRFRNVGKIYYFNPKNYKVKPGDHVIVETARGVEYGKVVLAPKDVVDDQVVHPLKEVLRVATKDDDEREKYNRERERDAFKICQKKIREHGLEMKLIDAEYTFDNNKVLFYFTADGRIDFRQLVKDLASIFKTRIELRQKNSWRNRYLRQMSLLSYLSFRVCTCIHPNGQGTESLSEPDEDFRCMRKTDVLSEE